MGLIRKMTSVSTLGLVSFRSAGERTSKYTRQTRNATRAAVAQNMQLMELQRQQLSQGYVHHVEAQAQRIAPVTAATYLGAPTSAAVSTPAGWYPDAQGAQRWWDGRQWTTHTT